MHLLTKEILLWVENEAPTVDPRILNGLGWLPSDYRLVVTFSQKTEPQIRTQLSKLHGHLIPAYKTQTVKLLSCDDAAGWGRFYNLVRVASTWSPVVVLDLEYLCNKAPAVSAPVDDFIADFGKLPCELWIYPGYGLGNNRMLMTAFSSLPNVRLIDQCWTERDATFPAISYRKWLGNDHLRTPVGMIYTMYRPETGERRWAWDVDQVVDAAWRYDSDTLVVYPGLDRFEAQCVALNGGRGVQQMQRVSP